MLLRFGLELLTKKRRSDITHTCCYYTSNSFSGYLAGTLLAPVSNLKVKKLDSHSLAIVFSGKTTPSGELHDPGKELQVRSSAREYETTHIRVSFP